MIYEDISHGGLRYFCFQHCTVWSVFASFRHPTCVKLLDYCLNFYFLALSNLKHSTLFIIPSYMVLEKLLLRSCSLSQKLKKVALWFSRLEAGNCT